MTITLTLPDELYRRVASIAGRHQISAERLAFAALAEQVAQWERIDSLAANASRDRFIAVMDKVADAEPQPEDRT